MGSTKYPVIQPPGGGTPSLPGQGQPGPLQPGEYGPVSSPTIATFNVKGIPPNGLYVTRNDVLFITAQNSATGLANLDLHLRLQLASPTSVVPGQPDSPPGASHPSELSNTTLALSQSFALGSTRATQNFTLPLQEGFLTNVSVNFSPAFSKKGQTYVRVILQRGDLFTGGQSGQLIAGYVTSFTGINWPGPGPNYSTDGAGWINSVNLGNPAAGADFVFTVPTNARWRVRSFSATYLVANAGVARIVRAVIKDAAANTLWLGPAQQTAGINATFNVSVAPGANASVIDPFGINIPLPGDVTLPQGFTIGTSTSGINVADQFSNIWAYVEEWIENAA